VAAFCRDAAQRLRAVVPAQPTRPVNVWAFDESRFGLQTIRRRRSTARGVKPIGRYQHRFANFYLYGCVAPKCGDGFFLGLATLDQAHVQLFLDECARARPDTLNVLLLDNARSHTAKRLRVPENVILLFHPPYAPEVNPVERVWEDLKQDLAWECFATLTALQDRIVDLLHADDATTLRSLTAYPYLMDAMNAVGL
jgi:transposase